MISFARELLCEVVQEAQPLLQAHYEELTLHKEVVRLDPQWDQYALLERLDRLAIFTARDDGKLAGYNAFFVQKHLHYAGLTVAQNDVLYFREENRRGTAPFRFINYCESELKRLGANKIIYHAKLSNNLSALLGRLGYGAEEVMCGKML